MALKKTMPMKPGTKPDPRFETVYDAKRGGHYPPKNNQPKPKTN